MLFGRRVLLPLGMLCTAFLACPFEQAAAEPATLDIGVGLSPAHFPNQSSNDVEGMFREAASLGSAGVILGQWDDANYPHLVEQMSMLARRQSLKTVLQLDIFKPGSTELAPPSGVSGSGFGADAATAYEHTLEDAVGSHPAFVIAASDVNRFLASGTDRLAEFAQAYKKAYHAAKAVAPETKVAVSFNLEIFRQAHENGGVPYSEIKKLVDLFRPELDMLVFTSMPSDTASDPAQIKADYFDVINELRDHEDVILSTGWPSSAGGEKAQAAFVSRLPDLTARVKPAFVLWPILHDLPFDGPAASLGLFTADDQEKAAAAAIRSIASPATVATISPTYGPKANPTTKIASHPEVLRANPADKFSISMSTLDGARPTLLASDPNREINHARVSPDGTKVVFTRYNLRNGSGDALETNGYFDTEAIVCPLGKTACDVVLPARQGIMAANASWTPDGKHLLYVTNATPTGAPGLAELDLATQTMVPLQTDKKFQFADPQQVGQTIVTPGTDKATGAQVSKLYLLNASNMSLRQLTNPKYAKVTSMEPPLGDYDPKQSADRRQVAVMRHMDQDDWATVVIDAVTGAERNLSGPNPVDAVPEWSSDDKLLIFWHVDRSDLKKSGLYTMRPDGADRKRVPLPSGYFYTMPAFFPNGGSGPNARIIYSAQPNKMM